MHDLLPYLCPFADCNLKDRMWGVRSEWETHLNDQHPILDVQGRDMQRYAFTCKICPRTFHIDDHSRKNESSNSFCFFRNSHYADHMERIASSVLKDYGPDSSAPSQMQVKKRSKRRRLLKYRASFANGHDSSSSGRDEEAISGWSSEGSTGSQG